MRKSGIAAALAVLLAFSSCAPAPENEPIRITLMHGWGGAASDHAAMRKIYEDFDKLRPEIELVYAAYPDISIVLDKASDMLALDRMPDIISTNGYKSLSEYIVQKDFALDFSPYLAADPAFAACIGNAEMWRTPNGAIYTISDVREISGYWYNEDILRQAGVSLPATWEEFWDCADRIAEWSEASNSNARPMDINLSQALLLMGALIASADESGLAFMQGKVEKLPKTALDYATENIARAYAYHSQPLSSDIDVRQEFFSGKTAFYFNGVWANTELTQTHNRQNIKYANLPGLNGGTLSYLTPPTGYLVSSRGSKEKQDACVKFVKYMVSEQTQRRIATEAKQAPSNPTVSVGWISEKTPVLGDALSVCDGSDQKIIALTSLLGEEYLAPLEDYLSIPTPPKYKTDILYNILSE